MCSTLLLLYYFDNILSNDKLMKRQRQDNDYLLKLLNSLKFNIINNNFQINI